MKPPAIELKNVQVDLGGQTILKNVNLSVQHGDTFVILGPSGSGKTVLLKTMAGIYVPTQGSVLVEGENWQNLESEEKHKLAEKIGMLFQKSALFDAMTALENVCFPFVEHTHLSEVEIKNKSLELLDQVGLKEAAEKFPHELSGGMQRRLGIARALALNPQILFYDDPMAGQDPINSDKLVHLILRLKKEQQATLIIVTNDLLRAYDMANHIVLVANQEVLDIGSVSDFKKSTDPRVQQFIRGDLEGPLKIQIKKE